LSQGETEKGAGKKRGKEVTKRLKKGDTVPVIRCVGGGDGKKSRGRARSEEKLKDEQAPTRMKLLRKRKLQGPFGDGW